MYSIGLFGFQVMVRLAVPVYLRIYTKRGSAGSALTRMPSVSAVVAVLHTSYPVGVPSPWDRSSGFIGSVVNLAIYLAADHVLRRSQAEQARIDALFAMVEAVPKPQPDAELSASRAMALP